MLGRINMMNWSIYQDENILNFENPVGIRIGEKYISEFTYTIETIDLLNPIKIESIIFSIWEKPLMYIRFNSNILVVIEGRYFHIIKAMRVKLEMDKIQHIYLGREKVKFELENDKIIELRLRKEIQNEY